MKKKLFFTAIIFTTGFFCGLFISECWAQPVKDNTVTITEGKVQYSVPEVYELMQVAIALTDTAIFTDGVNMYRNNVQTGTAYYKEVMQTFGSHRNHPFVKKLNESFSKSALNYIYQLQKAYNASFNNNNIVKKKRMPTSPCRRRRGRRRRSP